MTGAELELSPPLPANLATAVSIITASTTAVADAAAAAASTAAHVSLSVVLAVSVCPLMSSGRPLEILTGRALDRRRHRLPHANRLRLTHKASATSPSCERPPIILYYCTIIGLPDS